MKRDQLNRDRRNFLKKGIIGFSGITFFSSSPKMYLTSQTNNKEKNKKITTRPLGKTGLRLPIVSMGVMNSDNPNLVQAALDAGIIHLDTAHGYQRGRNEEMIGTVVKGRQRDSFVIATKNPGDAKDERTGQFTKDSKPGPFLKRVELSLKRLGLEYLDILHLHSVARKAEVLFEPYLKAMEKLKKEGKTRLVGISTHLNEPEAIRAAADSKVYDVVLTAYNFRQPHLYEMNKAIDHAAKAGLGVIAMKTQAGVYWDKERKHQINMKAALKWALQNEKICTAIPGMTTFDQLNLDLSVIGDITLTAEEKADLRLGEKMGMAGLYCWQCGNCVQQCRARLNIPALMRSFMYAYGYRNLAKAKDTLEFANLSGIPCRDCRTCLVVCTMGFDVRTRICDIIRLREVEDDFLV